MTDPARWRVAVPNQLVFEGADEVVMHAFTLACEALERVGMEVLSIDLPELNEIAGFNAAGGFTAAEAWAWHRHLLETREAEYDPRVSTRIKRGADLSAKYLIDLIEARADWIARVQRKLAHVDALIMPTVPVVAPALQPLIDDDALYAKTNLLALRNPTVVNFLDGCAVSLPCHQHGEPPVGLMVAMASGLDSQLLRLARACEIALERPDGLA
jgi:aspartyl-tRNA(Asn)/glutamyl-tRNA(Gln) amidotransferase subunit A